jgi:hypothetical protein
MIDNCALKILWAKNTDKKREGFKERRKERRKKRGEGERNEGRKGRRKEQMKKGRRKKEGTQWRTNGLEFRGSGLRTGW